uniref:Protein phytochrome kinase substrate 1-like n=1 Tax=Tanacetum cinerariifolium TaxID=118510 RepID=A0A6L2JI30_TANCI|nr:protein phytochrome kinase substrate 1-like [Tanacetum cinerariifolium]
MEMYSSFETSLTLQPRNSLRDVSFSSYLNKADENMIRKLTNHDHHYPIRNKPEEDEIDVFGAEKYFKGEIEDGDNQNSLKFIDTDEKIVEFGRSFSANQRSDQIRIQTPSIRSNGSLNSRSELISRPKQPSRKLENGSKTKNFFASFHCNCINKKSTQINEKKFIQSKPHNFETRTDHFSTNFAPKTVRNDYFSFPVLNSTEPNSNFRSKNLAGKVVRDNGNNNGQLSLGRKLTLLHDWDVNIPVEDEMYIPSSGMYNNDIDSDSSSDLFEIESFSTAGNSSFLPHRKSESNCYAPSEVSVDWSVVTASAADFDGGDYGGGGWRDSGGNIPVTENKDEAKKRPGILSGCTSYMAVRVADDESKVGGGGSGRPQRRMSDSMAVGNVFRSVNSLTRFDPTRGNFGSDVYPVSNSKGKRPSQGLYAKH